jgi:hypothetical protein
MTQKHPILNRHTISCLALVVILAVTFCVGMYEHHATTKVVSKPKTKQLLVTPSDFSFTGTTGWIQGATNKTSMALFHSNTDGCFTSAQYTNGIINGAAELQKNQDALASSGYTVKPTSTQMLILRTSTGLQQYQLHQYSAIGTGSSQQIMGGQEFGYLQLSSGYIKLMGYCNTNAELPSTIPALQAFKFNDAN